MDVSNVLLIRQCKQNDKRAFQTLLQQYEPDLYRICFGYLRNRDQSLEVMQEVYIRIFRSIQAFDEQKQFLPWAKKITINACLNYRRDNKRHEQVSLDDQRNGQEALLNSLSSNIDVEEIACTADLQDQVNCCIGKLPDNYRIALTLRYIEDMTYEQIATVLDIPLGTVKSNIARGRTILKAELERNRVWEA